MKNLIEQKNILLREASESLREVYRMSKVLADSKDMSAGVRGILIELVSEKLDELSSGWGRMHIESNISLEEPIQVTIDEIEEKEGADNAEDDLPFC